MAVITPNIPIVNLGNLYVNGLQMIQGIVNVPAAPNSVATTTIQVSPGRCRDSTDVNDIVLPQLFITGTTIPVNYVLNTAASASGQVNGLDQGALAAAVTLYYVYAIADSRGYSAAGTLLSLSATQPLLPGGYDMFRRIGTVASNAAGTGILSFHQRGASTTRYTWYNVPIDTALAAGASATLASFNWANAAAASVVPITAGIVLAKVALTADAGATRSVVFSADGSVTVAAAATVGEVIMSSPASTVTTLSLRIPASASAGPLLPMVSFYAVSNALAAVAVSVQGFIDQL